MEWRTWAHARLAASTAVTSEVPVERIFGAGAIQGRPEAPFIQLRLNPVAPVRAVPARSTELLVYAHDDPGSYLRVDRILKAAREALEADVTDATGIAAEWQGDSPDLADDGYDTITRNSSFRLLDRSNDS